MEILTPQYAKSFTNIKHLVIPEGYDVIDNFAFSGCNSISVVVPEGVLELRSDVFSYCESLSEISLPSSLQLIGSIVFAGCPNLTSVIIPNKVREIQSGAFSDCSSLMKVFIPDSVISIGEDYVLGQHAFAACPNLTIICNPGSCAEVYARKHGIKTKVINPKDITLYEEVETNNSSKINSYQIAGIVGFILYILAVLTKRIDFSVKDLLVFTLMSIVIWACIKTGWEL